MSIDPAPHFDEFVFRGTSLGAGRIVGHTVEPAHDEAGVHLWDRVTLTFVPDAAPI